MARGVWLTDTGTSCVFLVSTGIAEGIAADGEGMGDVDEAGEEVTEEATSEGGKARAWKLQTQELGIAVGYVDVCYYGSET